MCLGQYGHRIATDMKRRVDDVVVGVALSKQVVGIDNAPQYVGAIRNAGQVDWLPVVSLVILVSPAHRPTEWIARVGAVGLCDVCLVRRIRYTAHVGVACDAVVSLGARCHDATYRPIRVHRIERETCQWELVVAGGIKHARHSEGDTVIEAPHARTGAGVDRLSK